MRYIFAVRTVIFLTVTWNKMYPVAVLLKTRFS